MVVAKVLSLVGMLVCLLVGLKAAQMVESTAVCLAVSKAWMMAVK